MESVGTIHGSEMSGGSLLIPATSCPTSDRMAEELTKEEIERRAEETLRRMIATPPQPKKKPEQVREGRERVSKPKKNARAGGAS